MVTGHGETPFVFLTTSNACVPTGRNARAHARSESAKRSNPAKERHGCFGSFFLDTGADSGTDDVDHSSKRRRTLLKQKAGQQKAENVLNSPSGAQLAPFRVLATHFPAGGAPLPPNVNFEDVLKVAAFHIRRRAGQIINSDSDRLIEALRCRQWCFATAPQATLGRSPYLDSAIACVVSKVQQVICGAPVDLRMLMSYAEAVQLLRAALLKPALHNRSDMVSATHLLAIYEMLDFPNNAFWMQHIDGVAALVKLPGAKHVNNAELAMHAGPMFVEALLSNDEGFFESEHWRSLTDILVVKPGQDTDLSHETLACFISLRSILADTQAAMRNHHDISLAIRVPLLERAHELRFKMRSLILRSEKDIVKAQKNAEGLDILGLHLVSFITLNKLIMTLRREKAWKGYNLHADTQKLCNQMVCIELHASDKNPGEEILLALRRQPRSSPHM